MSLYIPPEAREAIVFADFQCDLGDWEPADPVEQRAARGGSGNGLDIDTVTAVRAELWSAGYRPIPVFNFDAKVDGAGKRPLGKGWQLAAQRNPPFCACNPAVPHAMNTGISSDGLRGVDIDIDDPVRALRVRTLALGTLGSTIFRTRENSGRSLLPYRAAEGSPGKRVLAGRLGKVEILGVGQQFVSHGRHPSGAELRWFPVAPQQRAVENLPSVTEDQVTAFLAACAPIIEAEPPAQEANGHDHHHAGEPQADPLRIAAALNDVPNGGPPDWEAWNRVGMAVWAATAGRSAGWEAWNAWSARNAAHDPAATRARWDHYATSPPTSIGAGMIFRMAREATRRTRPPDDPPPADEDAPEDEGSAGARPNSVEAAFFDPWAELQPPDFPINVLPPVLRAFVEDRARIIGADPCGVSWAAMSAASAALDGSIRLRMKRHDFWSVPPAIWVALIGRPSSKKTPMIDAAWDPLQRVQKIDLDQWKRQVADWKGLPKNERDPDEPKPKRRLVSHDGTMEALQDILGRQDRGIGVLRDELSGWLGSLEKYAGAKASGADRAFFLQAFNGGPSAIDRVVRGLTAINNVLVTICGGIQPDRLRQFSDLTDDGLWQRFVPIIVGPASRGLDVWPGPAVADYADAINRILTVSGATRVELSEGAHTVRADVEKRVFDLEQSEVLGPRFASFCGKLYGLWGRLCLVLNYLDPEGDTHFIVPQRTAERAAILLFQSVIPSAARVYAATGGAGADIEATRSVAGYILAKQKARVLASDLAHNVRACRGEPLDQVQRVVSPLVAGGWLTPEKDWNPYAWKVAPEIHAKFAARAEREKVRRTELRGVITGQRADDDNPE